jgi:putative RecB family exonuclease
MSALLLEPLPAADRRGGVWEYISPSRLNLWLRCPLAFKLQYIDGIRMPTTPSLFLGKAVHDGLEILYRHRQLGAELEAEDVAKRISDGWDGLVAKESMRFDSTAEEDALKQQALALVAVYMDHVADTLEIPLAVETSMEAPLIDPDTGEDLGIPLTGIVDLVVDERAGPLIVDFKTAAKSSPPFEITHEIQLSSYAYLFRQATGDEEGGLEIRSLVKTKTPKIEFHTYQARREQHFRRLFAVIRAYLDDLDRGSFVFRPGFACIMCDHRDGACRDWDLA